MDPVFRESTVFDLDNYLSLPSDPCNSIKFIVDALLREIYPLLKEISDKIHSVIKDDMPEEIFLQIRNVYMLCADQIKKCILVLFEVIKIEYEHNVYLQESRLCTTERLSWCIQKLILIKQLIEKPSKDLLDSSQEFMFVSSMYFVNWIDQTFDILSKLSNVITKNDFKATEDLSIEWKKELIECVSGLHASVDELLLSAMTLCKHCLPVDQYIVKARCQVVLRETKTLLSELIDGDLDKINATMETLKLPIMPFNINVRIDVLKDVLYVLETNTNTALLSLVVHCFSQDVPPVEMLKKHFVTSKTCTCITESNINSSDITEKCVFINEFDLYNERLLQIGSFAMSCSSDQKRILNLRSGLASLEALDPHLVPAVMLAPQSYHSSLLIRSWTQEMLQIRDSVFLIVDPAAFADKARQMMHNTLLEIIKENHYDNVKTCTVINTGCVVCEFFDVYKKLEPDALTNHEQLAPLLKDLSKVQIECKIVSNLLSNTNDYKYDVKEAKNSSKATNEQLIKRLKLLYTLVKRINFLYNPRENDDEFYEESIENKINTQTYLASRNKLTYDLTKSIFARTNVRCSTGKFPLAILTKRLKKRNNKDLSFSIKLDEICDMSDLKLNREPSILYHSHFKSKSSLRKVVLCKQRNYEFEMANKKDRPQLERGETDSVMDDAMSLQITDVLNQINDLTINLSTNKRRANSTVLIEKPFRNKEAEKITTLTINNDSVFKHVWNITVNNETASNITQPSEVNTLERIQDLDLVESKLSDLKSGHIETSL